MPALPLADENYEVHKDAVRDLTTQLEWQRHASSNRSHYGKAQAYREKLTLAGGGWRLPKMIELQSIVDFTRILPAINTTAFPDTPSEAFKYDPWRLESGRHSE